MLIQSPNILAQRFWWSSAILSPIPDMRPYIPGLLLHVHMILHLLKNTLSLQYQPWNTCGPQLLEKSSIKMQLIQSRGSDEISHIGFQAGTNMPKLAQINFPWVISKWCYLCTVRKWSHHLQIKCSFYFCKIGPQGKKAKFFQNKSHSCFLIPYKRYKDVEIFFKVVKRKLHFAKAPFSSRNPAILMALMAKQNVWSSGVQEF